MVYLKRMRLFIVCGTFFLNLKSLFPKTSLITGQLPPKSGLFKIVEKSENAQYRHDVPMSLIRNNNNMNNDIAQRSSYIVLFIIYYVCV